MRMVSRVMVTHEKKYSLLFGGMDGKYYLCDIKHKHTMTVTGNTVRELMYKVSAVNPLRELIYMVSEVDETRDPIVIVYNILGAFEGGLIGEKDKELLMGTLYRNCCRYGIEGGEDILMYID